ncbi:MAG TPA: hypothetical protein VGL84_01845 [Gaiellaceae bacterium]
MTSTHTNHRRRLSLPAFLAVAIVGLILATAASAASPQNTASPTISGTAKVGSTLTATNGTWSNSPTSYVYRWQRCATDGTRCGDVTGATSQTYTPASGDVHHTIRVVVAASNADGKTAARSAATDVVGSTNGPASSVTPAVSGNAAVGDTLTVSNGSWSPSATSFTRQWQRCNSDGTSCLNIGGATGRVYGVRTIDVGNRLRALVTAQTSSGQTTVASSTSDVVKSSTVTTTTSTTVTLPAHGAPKLTFVSLKRVHWSIYARYRVCTQTAGTARLAEHDYMTRALPYARHFSVKVGVCGSFSKKWLLLPRYRHRGRRYEVTLRATDPKGALSRLVSRSLIVH